jgi:hypothetical protein
MMNQRFWLSTPLVATVLSIPITGNAQTRNIDNLYVDLAVPDLPAMALLDLNPSKVNHPGTLKELSTSVFPIAGSTSVIGPGVAMAWAPVYTFAKSVDSYRRSPLRHLAFSVVTAKDGSGDAVNTGTGVRFMLFDRGDSVMSKDYENAIFGILESMDAPTPATQKFMMNKAAPVVVAVAALMTNDPMTQGKITADLLGQWDLRAGPPSPFTPVAKIQTFEMAVMKVAKKYKVAAPTLPNDLRMQLTNLAMDFMEEATKAVSAGPAMKTRIAQLDKQFRDDHWNAASAIVDFGVAGNSASGRWADIQGRAWGGLVSVALPGGRHSQIVLQLQGRDKRGTESKERSYVGSGARWLVGTSTRRLSIEGFTSKTDSTDVTKNGTAKRFTVGTEFRISEGFWLEAAFGSERTPSETSTWRMLSFANFKYAFRAGPRFTEIPGSVEED